VFAEIAAAILDIFFLLLVIILGAVVSILAAESWGQFTRRLLSLCWGKSSTEPC